MNNKNRRQNNNNGTENLSLNFLSVKYSSFYITIKASNFDLFHNSCKTLHFTGCTFDIEISFKFHDSNINIFCGIIVCGKRKISWFVWT